MMQSFSDEPVTAFALDMWNGSVAQCNAFISATGITYPMLRNAGTAGIATSYSTGWDVSFVIDSVGDIVYRQSGFNSSGVTSAINTALDGIVSGVDDIPGRSSFHLNAAYPNPFNPSTTISWFIGNDVQDAAVKVGIHDIRGRLIASLLDTRLESGREHSVVWNGLDDSGQSVSSGTYLSVVNVDGIQKARFLTLVK